jgi:hypothetical protein
MKILCVVVSRNRLVDTIEKYKNNTERKCGGIHGS